jgi:hypothetical protein
MNYILFDNPTDRQNLLPLTFTRPVANVRCGILTIAQKWEKHLKTNVSYLTMDYLQNKFPITLAAENIFVNGSICPTEVLVNEISSLTKGQALYKNNVIIAFNSALFVDIANIATQFELIETIAEDFIHIKFPQDIFSNNAKGIEDDFKLLTAGRKSQPISSTNQVIKPENVFFSFLDFLR